jgi:hypothetical protein
MQALLFEKRSKNFCLLRLGMKWLVGAVLLVAGGARAEALHTGDYMEDGFLKALTSTHSPVAALAKTPQGTPQVIAVVHHTDGLRFTANLNWHEGAVLFTLHDDGTLGLGEEKFAYPAPVIASSTAFSLTDPRQKKAPTHGYTFVQDADQTVARLALSGQYKSDAGKVVEFRTNGTVVGLGAAATAYSLDNDHVLGPSWDYFKLGDDGARVMAFRHQGHDLVLFPVAAVANPHNPTDDVGKPDFAHPVMRLHWVSDAAS